MTCRFCGEGDLKEAFQRQGRRFVRCPTCRGIQQPIDQGTLDQRGKESFDDGSFLEDIERSLGTTPDRRRFRQVQDRLPPGRLLELGPGAGHFLAAAKEAGYQVDCIELSGTIRDYLRRQWAIVAQDRPLEENLLPASAFDCAVSFNCIEHVLEPVEHMKAVRRVLRPGGVFLFSTCNADCVVGKLVGGFWSMFKPPDHVSIGSGKSFSMAAERAGLIVRRISYSEYAFETPIGLATGVRDLIQERVRSKPQATSVTGAGGSPQRNPSAFKRGLRNALDALNSLDERFSPALLTKLLGVSAAIRVELQRPDDAANQRDVAPILRK